MKDITIKGNSIKRELVILACCLAAAVIFDAVAITIYGKPFIELFQTVGYILFVAVLLYALAAVLRILAALTVKLFKIIKTK